jgi:menaquinone-dependent protoporphyrinogen IX oxidase
MQPSVEENDFIYEEIRDEPDGEVELLTIAYGTKKTVNTESAKRIASLLENKFGLEIDIVDLQHNPSLNKQYNNIIIGSSVEIGKWTTHTAVVKFLENNKYARIY